MNIFITGAASGIGYAQAYAFLQQGHHVFGFDVHKEGLLHLHHQFPQHFHYAIGSIANATHVQYAVNEAQLQLGNIDVLCNTAGILDSYAPTLATDEALWDNIFNTNVKGMYFVTNAILPQMIEQQHGIVINMSSIAGMVAGGGGAAYTASKHAVIGYTKQLSHDYIQNGIRANAIAPGAINTPMNANDFAGDGEMAKWVAEQTPAGRWATPDEVASVTLFLASDAASYIHATVIPVDGGWLMK